MFIGDVPVRLFKKLCLLLGFGVMSVGLLSSISLTSNNNTHSNLDHGVLKTAAVGQHDLSNSKNLLSADEIQADIDDYVTCTINRLAYSNGGVYVTAKIESDSYEYYSLGYYGGEGESVIPAMFELSVQDADGNILPQRFSGQIERNTRNTKHYVISPDYNNEVTIEGSIEIPANTTVVDGSVKIKNFLYCVEHKILDRYNEDGQPIYKYEIEVKENERHEVGVKTARKVHTANINDFVSFTPKNVTKFAGYYAFNFDVNVNLSIDDFLVYIDKFNAMFTNPDDKGVCLNIEHLKKGLTYVNVRFSFTKNTTYFKINAGTEEEVIFNTFPSKKSMQYGSNNTAFFIEESALQGISQIKTFEIHKPIIEVSVINKSTNKQVAQSNFDFRFGKVDVGLSEVYDVNGAAVTQNKGYNYIDGNLVTVLSFIGIAVIFFAVITVNYLVSVKKYANDEFKKVNKPQYWKVSIIGFLFFEFVLLDFLYLVFRTTIFNNAEIFANPLDILICVFTIVGFLLTAYFIRKYYIEFKENLEKRRREKLNLNSKQEDDSGTISTVDAQTSQISETLLAKKYKKQIEYGLYVEIFNIKMYKLWKKQQNLLTNFLVKEKQMISYERLQKIFRQELLRQFGTEVEEETVSIYDNLDPRVVNYILEVTKTNHLFKANEFATLDKEVVGNIDYK